MKPGKITLRGPKRVQYGPGHLLFLLLLVLFVSLAHARTGSRSFDHMSTGFPLTGMHARIDCEACHIAGVFKGTPRECRSCHIQGTQTAATLPPNNAVHNLNQQLQCDRCHRTAGWTSGAHFDHMNIASACTRCHKRGGGARPAPADRVHTTRAVGIDCSECHRSTRSFTSGATLDHSGITSGCEASGCHAQDKAHARGHSRLTGCQNCHSYPRWSNVRMDHSFIGATPCRACHVRGGYATPAPNDQLHVAIASIDCAACHSTSTFAGATVDHSLVTTGCGTAGCHASDRPSTPNHTSLISCESCHRYPDWSNVTMNHSAIGATLCRSCHTAGGVATAPPNDATHASIGSMDCSACHKSTSTFAGATGVDHSGITSGCGNAGCHLDDKNRAPYHAALTRCEACHRYPNWLNVNMNHGAIGSTLCKSCHQRGGIAQGPPNDSRHNNLGGRDCGDCHNTRNFD